MRFNDRSYRTLAPRPDNNRVPGELTLSYQDCMVVQRLFLILRPTMKASASSMRMMPAWYSNTAVVHVVKSWELFLKIALL